MIHIHDFIYIDAADLWKAKGAKPHQDPYKFFVYPRDPAHEIITPEQSKEISRLKNMIGDRTQELGHFVGPNYWSIAPRVYLYAEWLEKGYGKIIRATYEEWLQKNKAEIERRNTLRAKKTSDKARKTKLNKYSLSQQVNKLLSMKKELK